MKNSDSIWNQETRDDLRKTLQWVILGELRLAKRRHKDILALCREVYIQDTCPENEWDSFDRFSAEELQRVTSRLDSEKSEWPESTDCDRLDRVENTLRERGILLWQASPCCDTCTGGELPDRIKAIEKRHPGFRDKLRGYAFFHRPDHAGIVVGILRYFRVSCIWLVLARWCKRRSRNLQKAGTRDCPRGLRLPSRRRS